MGRAIQRRRFFQRAIDGFEVAFNRPDVQRDTAHVGKDDAAVGVEADERDVLARRSNNAYRATSDSTAGNIWKISIPFSRVAFPGSAYGRKRRRRWWRERRYRSR